MLQIKDFIELFKKNSILVSTECDESTPVGFVSYNSQDLKADTLFFCKGAHFKEQFLLDALENGATAYVSEKKYNTDAPCILVSDIRKSIYLSANFFYNNAWDKLNLVGITGLFFKESILALLRRQIGVECLELARGDHGHLTRQLHAVARMVDMQMIARVADHVHDRLANGNEVFLRTVLAGDHLFPIPLIHVDRMDIVKILIAADGVHIGVKTVANEEMIFLQSEALPFCQRMHHLRVGSNGGDIEGNGALLARKVIVQAGIFIHEEGRGNALQIQRGREPFLKGLFDKGDRLLRAIHIGRAFVALRYVNVIHYFNRSSFYLMEAERRVTSW